MKQLIVAALAMFAVSSVNAAQSCEPYTVQTGSESYATVYPCGHNYTINHKLCREGQQETFIVSNTDNDGSHRETVTCHNGSFYPASKVKHATCREGQTERFIVSNTENDGSHVEIVVCRNGRFVNAF